MFLASHVIGQAQQLGLQRGNKAETLARVELYLKTKWGKFIFAHSRCCYIPAAMEPLLLARVDKFCYTDRF